MNNTIYILDYLGIKHSSSKSRIYIDIEKSITIAFGLKSIATYNYASEKMMGSYIFNLQNKPLYNILVEVFKIKELKSNTRPK